LKGLSEPEGAKEKKKGLGKWNGNGKVVLIEKEP
jgi:hypothetical protein